MTENNDFPKGWERTTIGDIVSFDYGKGLRKDRRDQSGNIPVYGSNGIVGYHSAALVDSPCLVVGRKGTTGAVHLSKVPCWPIDTTYFVIPPDGINLGFLFYLLSSLQLEKLDRSTAIPGLNRNDAYAIEIAIPPFPEQERIVAKIEELFTQLEAGVAELQQARASLQRYRQAVLKSAVEGELTREWREAHQSELEPAEKLLARILSERRAKWEAGQKTGDGRRRKKFKEPKEPDVEGLQELPEGWVWTHIEPLLEVTRDGMKTGPFGTLLKKHEHREEGVPVIGIENIGVMQYVPGGKIHITSEKADQLAKYDVQEGDLVISRSGTVGEVAVIPDGLGEARLSTNVMRITLAPSGMRSMFLAFLFNGSPFVLGQVSDLCKGSTRDFLNQRILKSIIFPLPPLAEQDLIIQKVERRLSVADEIEKELDQALARSERLRQSILKRAFEGRLIGQKSNVIHQEISHGKNQNPPRSKSPG